jgi:Ca2+-binding RTX toxin-like protein
VKRQWLPGRQIGIVLALAGALAAVVVGTASAMTFLGTKAPNALFGTSGPDKLVGRAGNDVLKGRAGNDFLNGGRGRDTLVGGMGADRLVGGPGNDVIKASDGKADRTIDGGGGANTCVIDIPLDLSATVHCATLQAGVPAGNPTQGPGEAGGPLLQVSTAEGLLCLPLAGCAFAITGKGADALVGTVTGEGAVTSVANVAVNALITGTWLATGIYSCAPSGGIGYLTVTIGAKSTPKIPVDCG